MSARQGKNVLGGPLKLCSASPLTGFYRTGCCESGPDDFGVHAVCVEMNAEFLEFSRQRGNDLSTPIPEYQFPGLQPGDRWCLCAMRWKEAFEAGMAPPVLLESTDQRALRFVTLEALESYALEAPGE